MNLKSQDSQGQETQFQQLDYVSNQTAQISTQEEQISNQTEQVTNQEAQISNQQAQARVLKFRPNILPDCQRFSLQTFLGIKYN